MYIGLKNKYGIQYLSGFKKHFQLVGMSYTVSHLLMSTHFQT